MSILFKDNKEVVFRVFKIKIMFHLQKIILLDLLICAHTMSLTSGDYSCVLVLLIKKYIYFTWKSAFPLPGYSSFTSSFHFKKASSSMTSRS